MIIAELTKYNDLTSALTNIAPFTYQGIPATYEQADYWTTAFGCPDESITIKLFISSVRRAATIFYSSMISLLDCIAQEMSFYWDTEIERLYIHFEHDQCWWSDSFEYGDQLGMTDKDVIYIDSVKYLPLLNSILSLAQQQDLINYDKLAGIVGNVIVDNHKSIMDTLIEKPVYGNDFRLYRLPERDTQDYTRSELINLTYLYIDNYSISLLKITLKLQDKRLAQNIKIPIDLFSDDDYPDIDEQYIGQVIPLAYGLIKASTGIPIDSSAGVGNDVTFRQALLLFSLGTVQVKIDDVWTTKVPTSSDLSVGEFTLAEADGRNASGAPYECRVLGSVGIANTYASDCIIDLNERYLGVPFIDSSYDRTEWGEEEIELTTIGILFKEKLELFEAIRLIQSSANKRFRYDILPDGRRTIRIDDLERTPIINHIPKEKIQNIDELPVDTDRKLLAAQVTIKFGFDYNSEYYQQVIDDDNYQYVRQAYSQMPSLEFETALTTKAHAEARAAWEAALFKDVPKLAYIELKGTEFYSLRIYDMLDNVEITLAEVDIANEIIGSGREYYGIWLTQVIKIDPDFKNQLNKCTLLLTEKKKSGELDT
jgi:hypothetical protein